VDGLVDQPHAVCGICPSGGIFTIPLGKNASPSDTAEHSELFFNGKLPSTVEDADAGDISLLHIHTVLVLVFFLIIPFFCVKCKRFCASFEELGISFLKSVNFCAKLL
jgi:hypothetical protein